MTSPTDQDWLDILDNLAGVADWYTYEHAALPGYTPPTAIPVHVADPRERDHLAHLHEQLDTARALGESVEARIRYVRACAVALGGA